MRALAAAAVLTSLLLAGCVGLRGTDGRGAGPAAAPQAPPLPEGAKLEPGSLLSRDAMSAAFLWKGSSAALRSWCLS